jgi:hypothetical protein
MASSATITSGPLIDGTVFIALPSWLRIEVPAILALDGRQYHTLFRLGDRNREDFLSTILFLVPYRYGLSWLEPRDPPPTNKNVGCVSIGRSPITDVTIPGLAGVDLVVEYHSCKRLLFSGQAATMDLLEDACSKGYDLFLLLKPVHPSEFLVGIRARWGSDAAGTTHGLRDRDRRELRQRHAATA